MGAGKNKPSKNLKQAPYFEHQCIDFEQKHRALRFVQEYKSNGFLKNCANIIVGRTYWEDGGKKGFRVDCLEKSFEFYENYFGGCPDGCLAFKDAREAEKQKKREARKERIFNCLEKIKNIFIWFSGLPWQTQILIIFLLILFISPRWSKPLIEIIKAFK